MSLTQKYQMPMVEKCICPIPMGLISFPQARAIASTKINHYNSVVHFFVSDEKFLCLRANPTKYIGILSRFAAVCGLDYSLQRDMPYPLQISNIYQNKLLSRYLQLNGLTVIPNVVWSVPKLYDICFDGLPTESVLVVNSMGIKGNPENVYFWLKGYKEMLERLKPIRIIRYGDFIEGEESSISAYFPCEHLNRMRHGR